MAKGRKRDPKAIKKLKGNPGRRPLNENAPEPESLKSESFPKCPDYLTPDAKLIWARIARDLGSLNMISETDKGLLAVYCQAEALHAYACKQIKKDSRKAGGGYLMLTEKGNLVQSPWVAIMNKQALIAVKVSSEFGFSPSAREKVSVPRKPGGGTGNRLDELRKRREQRRNDRGKPDQRSES